MQVGEADCGIGRRDPDRLESPRFQRPGHLDGRQTRPRRDRPRGASPVRLDLGAVPGVRGESVTRQRLRQQPGFAAPHRVRLAGQAERPRTRLADLPGQEVKVDDAVVLPHADGALVQPLAVERQQRARACEPVGHRPDGRLRDARGRDQPFPVGVKEEVAVGPEALGVRRDEAVIHVAALEQEPADGVHQRDVAAGGYGDVERGVLGGVRPPGIDHDQLDAGVRLEVGLDPVEGHREGFRHVGPPDDQAIAQVDVGVAARRAVGAEARLVAPHGRCHAEPAVGVGVVRADRPLEQLDGQIARLAVELAAAIEGHRVRAVPVDNLPEPRRRPAERVLPPHRPEFLAARRAHVGLHQAVGRVDHFGQGRALGADGPQVGRRIGHAPDTNQLAVGRLHQEPTAHPAVGADRLALGRLLGDQRGGHHLLRGADLA